MICYDLRFPSLAQACVGNGAEVLVYASAWLSSTGPKHWLPLLQARAIECQAYVVAPNQCGKNTDSRTSHGHSVVIDPTGTILAELGESECDVLLADINVEHVHETRRAMPLLRRG